MWNRWATVASIRGSVCHPPRCARDPRRAVRPRFQAPLGHRALHVSGNSAAVESFAGSDHRGKYGDAGDAGVVTSTQKKATVILPHPPIQISSLGMRSRCPTNLVTPRIEHRLLKCWTRIAEIAIGPP